MNKYYYNPILNTDSYKTSHWLQYPPGTENVYSYIESRGGAFEQTVFFGLQAFLKEYLARPINQEMIDEANYILTEHGVPFNYDGWQYILDKHAGMIPVKIKAIQEGMVIPTGNILVAAEATDPKCYWVTSYIETALLRAVWYGTTVATLSWNIKQDIKKALDETAENSDNLLFKLHDFGARGVSSFESANIGGAAHLINFRGTDTLSGLLFACKYYRAKEVPGYSIPAAEHSSITSWGRANEVEAYRNMLTQFGGKYPLIAVVSDSYDIYNAVQNLWGGELKDELLKSGSTVVIRPDSGDPAAVVLKVVQLCDQSFGSTVNSKGYKVLNNVRVIQGDGINRTSIRDIMNTLKQNGYSVDNIALGMGGALLQQVNRDTLKFAMKASAIKVGDKWVDVFKDPITDAGKRSKRGRLDLYKDDRGNYYTGPEGQEGGLLEPVWENGYLLREMTFEQVRINSEL